VYAFSVFTHIAFTWSEWLLEINRVLKPDGWFLATFLGPRFGSIYLHRELTDDQVGMISASVDNPWSRGGPGVILSPWWIEQHWGRLFRIHSIAPEGFGGEFGGSFPTQGAVLMQPRGAGVTREDLEAPGPPSEREVVSLHLAKAVADSQLDKLVRRLDSTT